MQLSSDEARGIFVRDLHLDFVYYFFCRLRIISLFFISFYFYFIPRLLICVSCQLDAVLLRVFCYAMQHNDRTTQQGRITTYSLR